MVCIEAFKGLVDEALGTVDCIKSRLYRNSLTSGLSKRLTDFGRAIFHRVRNVVDNDRCAVTCERKADSGTNAIFAAGTSYDGNFIEQAQSIRHIGGIIFAEKGKYNVMAVDICASVLRAQASH